MGVVRLALKGFGYGVRPLNQGPVPKLHAEWYADFFAVPIEGPIPELSAIHVDLHLGQFLKIALDQRFRQGIFDVPLNRTSQRPGAIVLIATGKKSGYPSVCK